MIWLSVAAGGALGAVSRYGVTLGVARLGASGFPYATLLVNVLGSFCIGIVVAWLGGRADINQALRPMIQVGFLGAFTTFSAFSLDALLLIEQRPVGTGWPLYPGKRSGMLSRLFYWFARWPFARFLRNTQSHA